MSLINKMLQDLDRRQALGTGADARVARPAAANPQHREWFWRSVTVLLTIGVGWVLWTAFHMLPRPLVTDLAFRVAEEARARPQPALEEVDAVQVETTLGVAPLAPPPQDPPPEAASALKQTPPAAEPLKLAHQIETPVRPPAVPPAAKAKPAEAKSAPPPEAKSAPPPEARKASVDKRERSASASDSADAYFRRATSFLNRGRVSEAEDQLLAALKAEPSHAAARQAYVALLLEQQRVEGARRLLQEALAIDPTHPTFALALARIHAEHKDYRAALQVLEGAGQSAQRPEFQAMRGAVLQRLGRDAEAIEAYEQALRAGSQPATTWVGLAISLEAVGRKADAAAVYRKALTIGPLAAEAREYVQGRARALE